VFLEQEFLEHELFEHELFEQEFAERRKWEVEREQGLGHWEVVGLELAD
jgi:hypothetical protein